MFSDQLVEFPIDNLSSRSVDDILLFIHHRVVLHDLPNDIMGESGGVVVEGYSCTLAGDGFERITRELVLTTLTILWRDLTPHVGDNDDVLQCRVAAKFTEHPKIPPGDSGEPFVGGAVGVDDPESLHLLSYLLRSSVREVEKRRM